jgi:hypothetical protein
MSKDRTAHQKELAQSGYVLPDNFYHEPITVQPSAEKESGDGGVAASGAKQKSEHGYDGDLQPLAEAHEELDAQRTVDPETGQTIAGAGEKEGAKPSENKAARKGK